MKEHSDSTMFYYYHYWIPQSGRIPTRVNCLTKSTNWMDPTWDQYSCPQSGQTPWGLTVWQSPQSGRTPRGIKIHIHKVDGPHEGSRFMSTKWTDPTRVNCLTKSTKWTDPTRDRYSAHKVDEPHKGLTVWQSPQSGQTPRGINIQPTKWTDSTRDQYSAYKVDGPIKG